ncbi:MAG: ABC transporter ATP-binding protein [Lachnospiraceae bacterium]|nr:ABC transporter ATP-binding protein [Lachnospiraceae bacterium]
MIQTIDLVKKFDDFAALDRTTMHVPKGCVYGLVGPNGAGKSTLIRHITGIFKPTSGEVFVDGEPVWDNENAKAKTAYIPDDIFYLGNASTKDMMKYYKGIYPQFSMERYEKLQAAFSGIDMKHPIRRLSKGMQKQSAFLLAMCISPKLLVLDEPVDGLDPVMRRQIWSLIMADVTEHDTTVLVSSHNLRELEDVCDYVGIMDHGKIILERSLAELQGNICKVQIAFEAEMPQLPNSLNILHHTEMGRIHTLIVQASPNMAMKLLSPLQPILLEPLPLSLEEIFIYELGGTGYECKDILF